MAKKNEIVSLKSCHFKVTEDKLGTGRVVVWNELDIINSFTFETSYFGYLSADGTIC